MFSVKEITNHKEWNDFLKKQVYTVFVQSSEYIDFYTAMGESGFILGIYNDNELVGGSVIVSTHAKRGSFLYLPYGPMLPEQHREETLALFTQTLKKRAKDEGCWFVRVTPFLDDKKEIQELFQKNAYRPAPIHVLAENTWLLDVTSDEEQLLAVMNKNHRNLIRRCEREGVKIDVSSDPSALEDLHLLLDETAKRHHFHRFSRSYIEKEFAAFAREGNALVYRSYLKDGALDGAAVIYFYGTMAVYRHSGSRNIDKKIPTSYLIQWHIIQEAKKRGMRYYNFWGVAPENTSNKHPFHGITHFKKGFGGSQKDLLPCQDVPLSKKYWITWGIETIRRIKRGF